MDHEQFNTRPAPLLSTGLRIAAAAGVVATLALAWTGAAQASHEAVVSTTAALNRSYVTLPRVEIVARREAVPAAMAASTVMAPRERGTDNTSL